MADETLKGHTYSGKLTIPAAKAKIRYHIYVHLKHLYLMMRDWLIEEGWMGEVARSDKDWPERYYLKRETPRGFESLIWWRFEKSPTPGNTYYSWHLDVSWHIIYERPAELMVQGKKFNTQEVNLEIQLESQLELDCSQRWRNSKLLAPFHDAFRLRMFKADMEKKKHMLFRETYRFQEAIKRFVGMKVYMPEPEGQEFWQPGGVGDKEGLMQK